jgi:hypothetical protein
MNTRSLPAAIGAGWGIALLVAPERVVRLTAGRQSSPFERGVARLLGARHLVEVSYLMAASHPARRPVVLVECLHAASMVGLAAVSDRYRRPAIFSASVALALAALTGVRDADGR